MNDEKKYRIIFRTQEKKKRKKNQVDKNINFQGKFMRRC